MNNICKILTCLCAAMALSACNSTNQEQAKILELPPQYRTPDGMALGSDGNIYLSINQLTSGFKYPAAIARINANDKLEDFYVFDVNSPLGKISPMGIVFADGDLYIADNQMFVGKRGKSRILRLEIKGGKPVSCTSVVENLSVSNGIAYSNGKIYLTDCVTDDESYPMKSAVYGFTLEELKSGKPVVIEGKNDKHLVVEVLTRHDGKVKFGADGIAFDKNGKMYVANLGEAALLRYTINKDGKAENMEVLFKGAGLKSTDGLQFDSEGNLWIADFLGNAVAKFEPESGKLKIVKSSQSPCTPLGGELDTPAEAFRRGDKLYISNMNMEINEHKSEPFEAITIIPLE